MKKLPFRQVIFLCLLLVSCQKEFTVTTEKQEAYAVYCLLNLKDSAQYVRINRVFLTPVDPSVYLQEADSVNINAEYFEVTLQPFLEDIAEPPLVFHPSEDYIKEDGTFSTGHYKTFKTSRYLLPDRNYVLSVRNLQTGYEMKAETEIFGRRTIENTFKETRYYDINQYHPEQLDYDGDLTPGQWEKMIYRFLYYEYRGDQITMKYVDWRHDFAKSAAAGTDSTTFQLSDEVLNYLADNIPADTGVRRKAVGLDKMLLLNDKKLTIFIQYSEDQSSGHYIPVMTNFDQGAGLLASRYYYTYFALKFRKETIDTLAYGRFTRQLRFADSQGNWPPEQAFK
jgi:hypothetical protein